MVIVVARSSAIMRSVLNITANRITYKLELGPTCLVLIMMIVMAQVVLNVPDMRTCIITTKTNGHFYLVWLHNSYTP